MTTRVSFHITETTSYTAEIEVDPAEFERVTNIPFAQEHLTEELLREYERGNVLYHSVEESHGDVQGQTWTNLRIEQESCLNCHGTGWRKHGWAGGSSPDGITCPDCRGTGVDTTPYGIGSDHCPHCGTDWRQPHVDDCPTQG